jgi:hypothetical protein
MKRQIVSTIFTEKGQLKPVYAIQGHNVNLRDLYITRSFGTPNRYQVVYQLGWHDEEITTTFLGATDDNRSLIFANPTDVSKTIGVPIMNIRSCVRIK